MAKEGDKAVLKIVYSKADGYRKVPVTGAWGGLSPNGEIVADFFVEHRIEPEEITMEVTDDGPKEVDRKGGERLVRERQVGIVVRPDIALSIGNWLIDQAKKAGISQDMIEQARLSETRKGLH